MRIFLSIILIILSVSTNFGQRLSKETVINVYTDIVNAIGNNSPRAPRLEFKNSERNPASFNPFKKEIILEYKVLEICSSFGADSLNALSYILAHELAHSYCRHGWQTQFASIDFSNQIDKNVEAFEKRIDNETQADIYAAFFSHIAGYQALDVAPKFLEKIYSEYQLPDSIPGYPSFSQRIEIIESNQIEFNTLKRVYDSAMIAFSLGQYDYSTKLLDYIINSGFTSREMYNNLGLTFVYRALEIIDETSGENIMFPFHLDLDSRLRSQDLHRDVSGFDEAAYLLNLGVEEFQRSLTLSPDYDKAKENLYFAELALIRLGEEVNLTFTPEEIVESTECCEFCTSGCYLNVTNQKSKSNKKFKKGAANDCVFCSHNSNLNRSDKPNFNTTNNSEYVYDGIDIYCKDFVPKDCDIYIDTKNNLSICYNENGDFKTTFIKSKKERGKILYFVN